MSEIDFRTRLGKMIAAEVESMKRQGFDGKEAILELFSQGMGVTAVVIANADPKLINSLLEIATQNAFEEASKAVVMVKSWED